MASDENKAPVKNLLDEELDFLQEQAREIGLKKVGSKSAAQCSAVELRAAIGAKLKAAEEKFKKRSKRASSGISLDVNDGQTYAGSYIPKCNVNRAIKGNRVTYPPGTQLQFGELEARKLLRQDLLEKSAE